jgi:hypothetical protein
VRKTESVKHVAKNLPEKSGVIMKSVGSVSLIVLSKTLKLERSIDKKMGEHRPDNETYEAALEAADYLRKREKENPKLQPFHVTYQNDNYWAISSEWIDAIDHNDAVRISSDRHPMGFSCGPKIVRSKKQYEEFLDQKAEEDKEKDRIWKMEQERLVWPTS